jgi:hypothetical protein
MVARASLVQFAALAAGVVALGAAASASRAPSAAEGQVWPSATLARSADAAQGRVWPAAPSADSAQSAPTQAWPSRKPF